MKKILILVFISISILFLTNKFSDRYLFNRTSYEIREDIPNKQKAWFMPLLNFDGRKYYDIAHDGYYDNVYNGNLKTFFPLYPFILKFIAMFFKINYLLSGVLVSWISLVVALIYLNRLLILEKKQDLFFRICLLILFFPTSFYFLANYTESLFLLEAICFFYFYKAKDYKKASWIAAFSSATRIIGLSFFLILLITKYKDILKTKKIPKILYIAPLGFILYAVYLWCYYANPFLMVVGQSDWGRSLTIFGPLMAFYDWIIKIANGPFYNSGNYLTYSVILLEFFTALITLLFLVFSYKKINWYYWLYILIGFLLPIFTGSLASIPRYIIVLFPMFIFSVQKINKYLFYFLMFLSVLLMIFFEALFLRGYWVA